MSQTGEAVRYMNSPAPATRPSEASESPFLQTPAIPDRRFIFGSIALAFLLYFGVRFGLGDAQSAAIAGAVGLLFSLIVTVALTMQAQARSRQFAATFERVNARFEKEHLELVQHAARARDEWTYQEQKARKELTRIIDNLRRNEDQLRSITDAVPTLIFRIDTSQRITFLNRACEASLGLNGTDALGLSLKEFLKEPLWTKVTAGLAQARRGETVTLETEVSWAAAGIRFVQLTLLPQSRDGAPDGFVVMVTDLTGRKKIEQEQRWLGVQIEASRRRLMEIIANVPGIVWEAWGSPESGWRMHFVSDYAEQLLGYKSGEWLAVPNFMQSLFHPADREKAEQEFSAIYASGKSGVQRLRLIGDDARSVWVEIHSMVMLDSTGAAVGMRGVVMDISARKAAEEAAEFLAEAGRVLSESLDYRTTLRNLVQLVVPRMADCCILDMFDGSHLERLEVAHAYPERHELVERLKQFGPNPNARRGVPRVLRSGVADFVPELSDSFYQEVARNAEHLALLRELNFRSGLMLPLKARGRVFGAITLLTAESHRRYTNADFRLATELAARAGLAIDNALLYSRTEQDNEELEQRVVARTAALNESTEHMETFCYTIAHDLRAPLRAMQGFSQALVDEFADKIGEDGSDYARRILTSAERMDHLIQDLLSYSRLNRVELAFGPVDLQTVMESTIRELEVEARAKNASITIESELPVVRGHVATLQQVFANLLTNAMKFVAPGVEPSIRIRAEQDERSVRLWFHDNGIGIAPEYHERIFGVFERLYNGDTYPGTGVGLAIVRKGVERMGGRAGVDSAEGRGSRFWIELPKTPIEVSDHT